MHGNRLENLGKINLPVQYGRRTLKQEFIITKGISESCILGRDAILKHGFVLNGQSRTVYLFADGPGQAQVQTPTLINKERLNMPPRSSAICVCAFKRVSEELAYKQFTFTPDEKLKERLHIEPFIGTSDDRGLTFVEIINQSDCAVELKRKTTLGEVNFNFNIIGSIQTKAPENKVVTDKGGNFQVEEALTKTKTEYKLKLKDLLEDFKDIFAASNTELGKTSILKHEIQTEGYGPIRLRPYRTARKHQEELERQINEMLDAQVIGPSTSPWAAPVVLVEKKSGELRFCVDYRKLNAATKKDSFPLPRIDDTLDMLHGKKYFTTLDLASGYWQIELEEGSKEKTAFIVGNSLYEFNRMPFGLCNAPATFQRLMTQILRKVLGSSALVYLDDVIIFSDSFEDHLGHIREVFQFIKEAGLKLKLKKYQFVRESVEYLGHIISADGIAPIAKKIGK